MKAIYLKFPDEVDLTAYLNRDVDGYSVDVIGTIDGVDGWHVNMLVPDDFTEYSDYEIAPASPVRVFGGWEPQVTDEGLLSE